MCWCSLRCSRLAHPQPAGRRLNAARYDAFMRPRLQIRNDTALPRPAPIFLPSPRRSGRAFTFDSICMKAAPAATPLSKRNDDATSTWSRHVCFLRPSHLPTDAVSQDANIIGSAMHAPRVAPTYLGLEKPTVEGDLIRKVSRDPKSVYSSLLGTKIARW